MYSNKQLPFSEKIQIPIGPGSGLGQNPGTLRENSWYSWMVIPPPPSYGNFIW